MSTQQRVSIVTIEEIEWLLKKNFKEAILDTSFKTYILFAKIEPAYFLNIIFFLRKNHRCLFTQLTDVVAVDYLEMQKNPRFEVVYFLFSFSHSIRIALKVSLHIHETIPSLIKYYKSADWFEREIFDLYGIHFNNRPPLSRLLLDNHFKGHPLQKDFPLSGYKELLYDEISEQIIGKTIKESD